MPITGVGNTLLDSMTETCVFVTKTVVLDGFGGFKPAYVDGIEFPAVIRKDESMQARVAEKQGVTELYTVIVQKGFPLNYHDVFRRKKDGLTYRVTSNIADKEAPEASTIKVAHVTAERWDLPNA